LHSIAKNIALTQSHIADAVRAAGRTPGTVAVVAVSKRKPAECVAQAYAAGLTNFGENYLQEAIPKIAELSHLPLTWHFIGNIQSNKTRTIAQHFDWVHTVDRPKIAQRLNDQCPAGKRLQACLQVNVDNDPAKAGFEPDAVADVLRDLAELPALRLRGLMTVLNIRSDPLVSYKRLETLFDAVRHVAPEAWDTLSMGMSRDYHQAIACGATHVRIGTDIFGARS
jgi:pyridoxal phosphate enzyme (YggS family)